MNYLKQNLLFVRKRFGVTQAQLAFWLNKGQTTVGGWENGVSEPGVELLIRISDIFAIPVDHLLRSRLSDGNLITDDHVKEFKAKGNLIGNPIGKLSVDLSSFEQDEKPVQEPQSSAEWLLVKLIKEQEENGRKLDVLLDLAQKRHSKKA